ncbi:MAG: hypothetical protein KA383_08955 [Phycisphaerae bacterium]|nr:hypothetical protein [Phycisphaerae bacterium]
MSLAALLICTAALADCATQPSSPPPWKSIDLGSVGDVVLRLSVLPAASLVDEEWLGIEFENTSSVPARVENAYYHIERTSRDPQSRRIVSSGSLASGNTCDLFPEAWQTTPVAAVVIPAGSHRVIRQPSEYSSALLGLAPPGGLIVEARFHITLELTGDQRYTTPETGVAFTFEWQPVAASQFDLLRARLRRLLQEPRRDASQVYILQALLKVPDVSAALTARELLDSLAERDGGLNGRHALVAEIAQRYPRDPAVLAYYAAGVRAGDRRAAEDLAREPRIWDPTFLEPLLSWFEHASAPGLQTALAVLSAHRADWPADAHIPARLSRRLIAQSRVLSKAATELDGDDLTICWVADARDLAITHDPQVIPLLRPFLDRRERIVDLTRWGPPVTYPGPALRVCDVALEAILTLRGDDLAAAYARAGRNTSIATQPATRPTDTFERTMDQIRDGMIVDLRSTLSK